MFISVKNWTNWVSTPSTVYWSISACRPINLRTAREASGSRPEARWIYGSTPQPASQPASYCEQRQRQNFPRSSKRTERKGTLAKSQPRFVGSGTRKPSTPPNSWRPFALPAFRATPVAVRTRQPASFRRYGLPSMMNSNTCSDRSTVCSSTPFVPADESLLLRSIRSKTEWSSRPFEGKTNG